MATAVIAACVLWRFTDLFHAVFFTDSLRNGVFRMSERGQGVWGDGSPCLIVCLKKLTFAFSSTRF